MNSYGARSGGIVGVIGGREGPRLSADSTAIDVSSTMPAGTAGVKGAAFQATPLRLRQPVAAPGAGLTIDR